MSYECRLLFSGDRCDRPFYARFKITKEEFDDLLSRFDKRIEVD